MMEYTTIIIEFRKRASSKLLQTTQLELWECKEHLGLQIIPGKSFVFNLDAKFMKNLICFNSKLRQDLEKKGKRSGDICYLFEKGLKSFKDVKHIMMHKSKINEVKKKGQVVISFDADSDCAQLPRKTFSKLASGEIL